MNQVSRSDETLRTTQAAEGLPRWRWTAAELIRLTELGAFTAEDRLELIGGEIVPMSPVGRRHEVIATEIEDHLRAVAAKNLRVRSERQLNLSNDTYCKPDIFVHDATIRSPDVRGETVVLIIEIAESSTTFDLGRKAELYAAHGVREYWVVRADTLITTVHRSPRAAGFTEIQTASSVEVLTSTLAPSLTVRLADLSLD